MAIRMKFAGSVAGAALVAVGLWSWSAFAAVPPPVPATLTQQGRILDKSGTPSAGKIAFVFTIYDDPTKSAAADALWSETQDITLDDGYFSAQLGSVMPIPASVFDGSARYLGITVGSDAEMTPRETIASIPYAFAAGSAATATVGSALDTRIATLEALLACPDATARTKFGFCIWHEDNGATYSLNYFQAASACKAKGGRLCTLAEVSAAQAAGAEWCAFSWVADRVDNANAYTSYPMQHVLAGCGAIGTTTNSGPMTGGADANCCKP